MVLNMVSNSVTCLTRINVYCTTAHAKCCVTPFCRCNQKHIPQLNCCIFLRKHKCFFFQFVCSPESTKMRKKPENDINYVNIKQLGVIIEAKKNHCLSTHGSWVKESTNFWSIQIQNDSDTEKKTYCENDN